MPTLEEELQSNFNHFSSQWKTTLKIVTNKLEVNSDEYFNSYVLLASINAWRQFVIESIASADAKKFFDEAQNDLLLSHVFAQFGSWRISLMCLRACIENVLSCEFYKDHPVELILWNQGKHRVGFHESIGYFSKHPQVANINGSLHSLPIIEKEYGILSRAVHASSPSFRMTIQDGYTQLWSADLSRLSAWRTREKKIVQGINMFLLVMHRDNLQGAAMSGLRQIIARVINRKSVRQEIRNKLGINLFI
jgi:hypothetical protein